jgi:hypothetical protein
MMPDANILSPPSFLKRAIKAVPAVKYALGVGGIIAVIAIVSSFHIGFAAALFGTVVMLALMTVLVVFASLAGQKSSSFRAPALVLTWFSLVLFMVTASTLFFAVFWGNVDEIRTRLGIKTVLPPTQPSSTIPAGQTTQTTTNPSGTESSANPASALPKQGSPEETPHETPKEAAPTPTAQDFNDAQNEALAHGHEAYGDTAAEQSISYMYCGLQGCNNKPPNQADVEHARKLWAYTVSQWTLAFNITHNTAYSDRLREKIRPESGVTCDDHSCESNSTHENRSFGIHIPANQFD